MKTTLATTLLLFAASTAMAESSKLDDQINLNLRGADAAKVLTSFGHVLSVDVDIDPAIDVELSIQLDNVSVRTTLNAICESVGCEWSLHDGTLRFVAAGEQATNIPAETIQFSPLNLDLKEAGAAEFFQSLAQILEADLDLDQAVDGAFSIRLEKAGLDEILSKVCTMLDCVAGVIATEDGRVLEVGPRPTE